MKILTDTKRVVIDDINDYFPKDLFIFVEQQTIKTFVLHDKKMFKHPHFAEQKHFG